MTSNDHEKWMEQVDERQRILAQHFALIERRYRAADKKYRDYLNKKVPTSPKVMR